MPLIEAEHEVAPCAERGLTTMNKPDTMRIADKEIVAKSRILCLSPNPPKDGLGDSP